uniref:Zymogen granule membrane protein 16-like n=1 Tax=Gouania willdenowi TaxID=441366 RepID=A0A8C5GAB1_GOUWI
MLCVAVFSLLALSAVAVSKSVTLGSGSGTTYSITGEDRITAIRVWERYSSYITGLQVCYGLIWSERVGREDNTIHEMELYDGERIIQVSGKYTSYIQSLVFVTNMSRSLFVGQPSGYSFNMFPTHEQAELRFLSGRASSYISSIGTHWAIFTPNTNDTMSN